MNDDSDDSSHFKRGRTIPTIEELMEKMSQESDDTPNEEGSHDYPISPNDNRRQKTWRNSIHTIFPKRGSLVGKDFFHARSETGIELPPSDKPSQNQTPLITWRKTTFQDLQPIGSFVGKLVTENEDDPYAFDRRQSSQLSFAPASLIRTASINFSTEILRTNSESNMRSSHGGDENNCSEKNSMILHNAKSFTIGRSRDTAFAIKNFVRQNKRHRQTFDSYDYQIVDSKVWHDRERNYDSYRACCDMKTAGPEHTLRKNFGRDARVAIILLGISVALGGIVVIESSDHIFEWKVDYIVDMAETFEGDGVWGFGRAFLVNISISCTFALVAFMFVVWSPASQGSGLAEVKTILNGVHLEKITSLWTGLAKCTGVVFAVSSGLPVGVEGPMIHLGLVLGAHVSRMKKVFHSDHHRRDFAACGTAAGVTSAFHTPIGGVLFALEEGASFWSTLLTWRAFSCAIVTMMTIYFVYGARHWRIPITVFHVIGDPSTLYPPEYSFWELVEFALIGSFGGIFGALWILVNTKLSKYRRILNFWGRLVEIMAIVIVMAGLMWWISYYEGTCIDTPANSPSKFFTKVIQYNCDFFGRPNASTTWDVYLAIGCHCWVGILFYVCYYGIFMPALLMGACLGRAIGEYFLRSAQTYAIVGAGAMLGGITRVLISISVIISEGIGFTYMLVPLMLVFLIARTVGNMCGEGLYEVIIHNRKVPFLEEEIPALGLKRGLRVSQIMTTDPLCLPPVVRVGAIRNVLEEVSFNGFPVIDPETKCMIGLILRKHLEVLLYRKHWAKPSAEDPLIPEHIKDMNWNELEEFYPFAPPKEIVGTQLRLAESGMLIDLTPYIQIAPHTFEKDGSAERAYVLFRSLGLRHLPIVDNLGYCVGILTRANLTEENLHHVYSKCQDSSRNNDLDLLWKHFRHATPEPVFDSMTKK